jgi:hypothetical protein
MSTTEHRMKVERKFVQFFMDEYKKEILGTYKYVTEDVI